MLAPSKLEAVHQLIATSSTEELIWISGYLAGLAKEGNPATAINSTTALPTAQRTITIVYATETGNSKKVATMAAARLKQQSIKTKLLAVENYRTEWLAKETYLVLAISTQGEGEPPATAKPLYDFLHQSSENLHHLKYSIVALGSKSYPLFCQAGIDIDAQLKRLKATPFVPLALCDDDYEPVAEAWATSLLDTVLSHNVSIPPVKPVISKTESRKAFKATIGANFILNDHGSNKQVHHLELDLPEELIYTPGNAVGIVPHNSRSSVNRLLPLLKLKNDDALHFKGEKYSAAELLETKVSIHYLTLGVVRKYAQLTEAEIPDTRMDLYDLLRIYPPQVELDAQAVIDLLLPITPRLYTISSAPNAHPGQIHLTVALHQFTHNDAMFDGFGSRYVTSLKPGTTVELFLHQQKNFQIPRSDRHLIMIAQGTGIAPFRSMIAERDITGATGKNWLLFGEENFLTDFYYQTELQGWVETGSLHHVNLAFQKNRKESLHVYDILKKEADRLWQWLQSGAHVLVSGAKEPMGKSVEEALLAIIADKKKVGTEEATDYLKKLTKEGRYARELY